MNDQPEDLAPETPAEPAPAAAGALPNKEEVLEAIRPVVDPEMNVSIVDLGLVYDVEADDSAGKLNIKMTLTSPMCPVGPQIMGAVHSTALQMDRNGLRLRAVLPAKSSRAMRFRPRSAHSTRAKERI